MASLDEPRPAEDRAFCLTPTARSGGAGIEAKVPSYYSGKFPGFDAINPVQVAARGMQPEVLKAEFGDRLTFWGGIDTQRILPFGTVEEVRAEVRRIIDILGPGGGFVLNSVHNIQGDVPPENIVAMFDEARSYRRNLM